MRIPGAPELRSENSFRVISLFSFVRSGDSRRAFNLHFLLTNAVEHFFCLLVAHLYLSLGNVCSNLLLNLFTELFIFLSSTSHANLRFPEVVIPESDGAGTRGGRRRGL